MRPMFQRKPRPALATPRINLRVAAPNAVTIAALCAGLTAMVFAGEGRIELAVLAVFAAGLLDGCDGRLARLTGGATRFGGELDSLSDVVCFGAAPAYILYQWQLASLGVIGWLPCLALAACCALRLARFNVALDEPGKPSWKANYFTGVPAPGGAFLALLPVSAAAAGLLDPADAGKLAFLTTPAVAALMVSRWPTFSGKSLGRKAPQITLLPPLALGALLAAGLLLRPWTTLVVMGLLYVATLPLSKWRHDRHSGKAE